LIHIISVFLQDFVAKLKMLVIATYRIYFIYWYWIFKLMFQIWVNFKMCLKQNTPKG